MQQFEYTDTKNHNHKNNVRNCKKDKLLETKQNKKKQPKTNKIEKTTCKNQIIMETNNQKFKHLRNTLQKCLNKSKSKHLRKMSQYETRKSKSKHSKQKSSQRMTNNKSNKIHSRYNSLNSQNHLKFKKSKNSLAQYYLYKIKKIPKQNSISNTSKFINLINKSNQNSTSKLTSRVKHTTPINNQVTKRSSKKAIKQKINRYSNAPVVHQKTFDLKCQEILQNQQIIQNLLLPTNFNKIYKMQFAQQNKNKLKLKQKISWKRRAFLVNSMFMIGSQLQLTKNTIYIAVQIFDRYLLLQKIQQQIIQIFSLTCLYIAGKLQEVYPTPLKVFLSVSKYKYKIQEIQFIQKQILKVFNIDQKLKWKLNYTSIILWADYSMYEWDKFIQKKNLNLKFRSPQQQSYEYFRQIIQFIDCSILQVNTFAYQQKMIPLSFMYFIIGNALGIQFFNWNNIGTKFKKRSTYLFQKTILNQIFNQFIQNIFEIKLVDMLPSIQYCSSFGLLNINYDIPKRLHLKAKQGISYQQFLSYHIYCDNNYQYIKCRQREYNQ